MFIRKYFLATAIVMLAGVSFVCLAATGSYKVSSTLLHNGKPFSSPTVIVKPGVPANVVVSGKNGYKLSLTVTALGDHKVKVSTKVNSAQYGKSSPVVIVRLGQPATVKVGRNGATIGVKLAVTRAGS